MNPIRPQSAKPLPVSAAVELAAKHAPYLEELFERFPEITSALQAQSPDKVLSGILSAAQNGDTDFVSEMAGMRIAKQKIHLLCALCDIACIWHWPRVTQVLTDFADVAMQRFLRSAAREAGLTDTPDTNPVPGLFILALGKYGSGELNYSSDIDFIVFYDPETIRVPDPKRPERSLIKLVQKVLKGFDLVTEHGYVFRTDLRLRPDPRSNAIVVSARTAERYYETLGQNWERAAMIKARACAGDIPEGQAFIKNILRPFIWRKNLDYAAISDIHSIKRQIHARQNKDDLKPAGHHLKLGRGGIREIEFFAQTQQLILGGRDPGLRVMRTVEALQALHGAGYVDAQTLEDLTEDYAALRDLEHRVQMLNDEQTHICPEDDAKRRDLAALYRFDDLGAFDTRVKATLSRVRGHYDSLFPDAESLSSNIGSLVFTGVEPEPDTERTLKETGFTDTGRVWRSMADWLGGRISATRTERARELLTRLAPRLIEVCGKQDNPDMAFAGFSRFLTGLSSGVTLLSMLVERPDVLERIIRLTSISARLSDTLAAQPHILDGLIDLSGPGFDPETIMARYQQDIGNVGDFESALNTARRNVREDQFKVTAELLEGKLDPLKAGRIIAAQAQACVQALLPVCITDVERRMARPEGSDAAVIALGKMGGREMTVQSDIDIMLLYTGGVAAAAFYTKVTQRLINALSVQTGEGGLYDVDMALRPSGRKGPVAVSLDAFATYYKNDAWTWEFMALSRARIVASTSPEIDSAVIKAMTTAFTHLRPPAETRLDIANMRARLLREKPATHHLQFSRLKGGLREAEFIAQTLWLTDRKAELGAHPTGTLDMLSRDSAKSALSETECGAVKDAVRFYLASRQIISSCFEGAKAPSPIPETVAAALSHAAGTDDITAYLAAKEKHLRQISDILDKILKAH